MCLAVPLRIIAIQESLATVEMSGVQRQISLVLTPEAQVGDYVLVHTGYAINVLDEAEAQETLRLFAEIAEADAKQSGPNEGQDAV
ncbi:MAG: HypC/HybG/HupF family hydrogenase formation chaperone [Chloroflexi bacterium]|nr:HypC/HybG/HupF family hydrogenase formation chaperone [Chloroflexota bacterium]